RRSNDSSEHGVAGAVRDITGTPLVGAAEGALGDQAVGFVALGDSDFLAVDDHLAITPGYAAPGQSPRSQLTHRFGRGVDEHPHNVLVGAPVAAADRIFEVHVFVVRFGFDDIPETRLATPPRRRRIRTAPA